MVTAQAGARRFVLGSMASAPGNPATSGLMMLTLAIVPLAAVVHWLVEGWAFLDELFFPVATISTVTGKAEREARAGIAG